MHGRVISQCLDRTPISLLLCHCSIIFLEVGTNSHQIPLLNPLVIICQRYILGNWMFDINDKNLDTTADQMWFITQLESTKTEGSSLQFKTRDLHPATRNSGPHPTGELLVPTPSPGPSSKALEPSPEPSQAYCQGPAQLGPAQGLRPGPVQH